MAGILGNVAWVAAQRQTAKGVAPTVTATSAYKMPLTGGGMAPTRTTDNLSETDASRDRGNTYVQQTAAEGSPEFYVRDASIAFWLFMALGADAPTGSTNYTHAITPANVLPYCTLWRDIGDTLYETFADCKVGSISIAADAGSPLTATVGVMGRSAVRSATPFDAATPVAIQSGAVYNFNDVTGAVLLGGGATALISSFELTVENNLSLQQTDASIPFDVVEGTREISLGFDMIFATMNDYNNFHYGTTSGTTQVPTTFTTSAQFTFTKGVNNSVAFNIPVMAYEEFPVEANAGGDPIVVSVRAAAQRNAPIITATVKNQIATY